MSAPDPNAGQFTDCPYCKNRHRIPGAPSAAPPPRDPPLPRHEEHGDASPRRPYEEDDTLVRPPLRRIEDEAPGRGGFAIAAIVLGILSVVICFPPLIGLPFAILAIVFGFLGRGVFETEGMAVGGIVLGSIGLLIQGIWFVVILINIANRNPYFFWALPR
jgi:hypothetical protein